MSNEDNMNRHPSRKSLIDAFSDRSGKSNRTQQNPINRYAQYFSESVDEILPQVLERIEPKFHAHLRKLQTEINLLRSEVQLLRAQVASLGDTNIPVDHTRITTRRYPVPSISTVPSASGAAKQTRWTKLTHFFKQRSTIATLKERNIYKDEICFNTPIEDVVKHENYRTVPKIVVECITLIEARIRIKPETGLYRVSGDHVEIQKLRFKIDANDYDCLKRVRNVHTLTGVLKLFLREIQAPLVKEFEIRTFVGSQVPVTTEKIENLRSLFISLPEVNRDTLGFLLNHFKRICELRLPFTTPCSIAVAISGTIFQFTPSHRVSLKSTLCDLEFLNRSLELMIAHCDEIC